MHHLFAQYLFLIIIILALVFLSERIKVAYPIILVIGGLLISVTNLFSDILIDPEIVFLIFLPPLLYEAAWQTSWKEFWKFRRVIISFAFPIVILTSTVIAIFAQSFIPGFTLALGFLLGGIISPPDAVSATTIMRQVNAPKQLVSIIEGESLLNDASSLIIFQFAVLAVIKGQFSLQEATGRFFIVVIAGTLTGIAIAFMLYWIHRLFKLSTSIQIVLSLLAPYAMYLTAEQFHVSGVLAVVSGGLYLSTRRHSMMDYQSRIQGLNVWSNFVFVLNGLVFLLIGLELPIIVKELGPVKINAAIGYGLAISGVLIVTRLACAMGASVFTKWASKYITVADANPGWKNPLVIGWAGMRGVVSLAAALSIPLLMNIKDRFPQRNLILFIAFVVILVTLVVQGLTLPWLIRKLGIGVKQGDESELEKSLHIQKHLADVSLKLLDEKYHDECISNPFAANLKDRLRAELQYVTESEAALNEQGAIEHASLLRFSEIYLHVLDHQRTCLLEINKTFEHDEELIRGYLALLDMEEYKVREKYGLR